MGWTVKATPLRRERDPATRFTGGWVGPGAGLDGCSKSRKSLSPPEFFLFNTVSNNSMADELIFGVGTTLVPSASGPEVMCGCRICRNYQHCVLWAGRSGILDPPGTRDFSLLQNSQTPSGAHPASCSMRNADSFSWIKGLGRESGHSSPFSADCQEWRHTCPSVFFVMQNNEVAACEN